MDFALIGELIGAVADELIDLSRAGVAAALREVAEKVERGDLVSDDRIDQLKASTNKVRDMLAAAKNTP